MGNNPTHTAKKQGSSLIVTRMIDPRAPKTNSLPPMSLPPGAASLTCLAAEHHQIHDQESLDAWRTKALHTIDNLYEQKASSLKQEAQVYALLGQLRAVVDEDVLHRGSGYFMDDHSVQHSQKVPNGLNQ